MSNEDQELAELLAPSTFSLEECRARSRAARTPEELSRILRGEKRVMEARAERIKLHHAASPTMSCLASSSHPAEAAAAAPATTQHTWSLIEQAKIKRGKEAAHRLRASADVRSSLRDSWARSSVASDAGSAAGWYFKSLACKSMGAGKQGQLRLDFSTLRRYSERYSINSARSTLSSIDIAAPSNNVPCHTLADTGLQHAS